MLGMCRWLEAQRRRVLFGKLNTIKKDFNKGKKKITFVKD